jgi:hypothetical protein
MRTKIPHKIAASAVFTPFRHCILWRTTKYAFFPKRMNNTRATKKPDCSSNLIHLDPQLLQRQVVKAIWNRNHQMDHPAGAPTLRKTVLDPVRLLPRPLLIISRTLSPITRPAPQIHKDLTHHVLIDHRLVVSCYVQAAKNQSLAAIRIRLTLARKPPARTPFRRNITPKGCTERFRKSTFRKRRDTLGS